MFVSLSAQNALQLFDADSLLSVSRFVRRAGRDPLVRGRRGWEDTHRPGARDVAQQSDYLTCGRRIWPSKLLEQPREGRPRCPSRLRQGVHLYDTSAGGAIWVYLPLERIEDHRIFCWRCDVLTVYPDGEASTGPLSDLRAHLQVGNLRGAGRPDLTLPQCAPCRQNRSLHVLARFSCQVGYFERERRAGRTLSCGLDPPSRLVCP